MKNVTIITELRLHCDFNYSPKCYQYTFFGGEYDLRPLSELTAEARSLGWKIGRKEKCPACVKATK